MEITKTVFWNGFVLYRNKKGERHREDDPAVEHKISGYKAYYQNDKLHRLDGPAVEAPEPGIRKWYINGKEYIKKDYWQHPDVIAHRNKN